MPHVIILLINTGYKCLNSRFRDWICVYIQKFHWTTPQYPGGKGQAGQNECPLLGCTIKPKLGLSAKNYGRAVYERLSVLVKSYNLLIL